MRIVDTHLHLVHMDRLTYPWLAGKHLPFDLCMLTLTADLGSWVAATREIVAGASPDEQAKRFHRDAERINRI